MNTDMKGQIYSTFSTDPDMAELVEEFVGNLEDRIASLKAAFDSSDVNEVARLAHQMKGASGGYGFDILSDVARELEFAAKAAGGIEQVKAELDQLVDSLRRATADPMPE